MIITGYIMKCLGLSCVCPVYFLRKSTDFHDMWTDRHIILVCFLLIIYHKFIVIAKRPNLPYLLQNILSLVAIYIATQFVVYI